MEAYKLIQAIKELSLAQSSLRESRLVVERYPELLMPETIEDIWAKAAELRRRGENSMADRLSKTAGALTELRDALERERPDSTSIDKPPEPGLIGAHTPWTEAARQYLALRKDASLQTAIAEAERIGENAIARVLRACAKGDVALVVQITQTENIYPTLQAQGRNTEGYILNLLYVDFLVRRIQFFAEYPLSEQQKVLESGLEACSKAIALCDLLGDEPCKAFYIRHMAIGCSLLGHSESAITQFQDALKIYRELAVINPQEYKEQIAQTLVNLCIDQSKAGEHEMAVTSCQEAVEIYREYDRALPNQTYDLELAGALYRMGTALVKLRDYERAVEALDEAIEIYNTSGREMEPDQVLEHSTALHNLGVVYSESRQFLKAANAFTKALEIKRGLAESKPHAYNAELAMTLNSLGTVQIELGELRPAISAMSRALEIYRMLAEVSPVGNTEMVAQALHNLATAQEKSGQFTQAITSLTEALEIRRSLTAHYPGVWYKAEVAQTLNSLGAVYFKMGNLERAEETLKEALDIKRPLAERWPQLYNHSLVTSLNNLGQVFLFGDNWDAALVHLEQAKAIIEHLREGVQDLDRRRLIFQENLNVYRGLLVCYVNLSAWDKALEIAEQGKSRSVSDLLNLKTLRPKLLLDRAPSDEEITVLEELADRYENAITQAQQLESLLLVHYQDHARLSQSGTDTGTSDFVAASRMRASLEQEIASLEKQKAQAVAERNRLLQSIRQFDKTFPPRAELLTKEQIVEISCESNRIIVLFRVAYGGTYIFVVFPDGTLEHQVVPEFNIARLGQLTELWFEPYNAYAELVEEGQDELAQAEFLKFIEQMKPLLALVYRELLKPLHDLLKAAPHQQYEDILFVPNNALAIWPLHACCWDENGVTRYLLDDYRISYATSVSVFKHSWENAQRHGRLNKFFFVTNPTGDLSGAETEVNQIIEVFGLPAAQRKEFRGDAAQKISVKETLMKDTFGFYHFSCHGQYNRDDAFSSPLSLADGQLTLKEILEINFSAAWLTTLSACETGLVNFDEVTDEHYGFPLGFIFAGCPSVWATLWMVNDKSTSELMQKAYSFLKDGHSKVEALRLAQINYRKEKESAQAEQEMDYSLPYFWAGFQHYGV